MRLLLRLCLIAVPLVAALPLLAAESETYQLRYRYKKGDVLTWNVEQTLRITTSVKGKTETVETSSRSTKIWTVIDIADDGTATFEYKVGDVNMKRSQTDMEDEKYDSRVDKEIPPAFQPLEGTIGVPLAELSIDPLGERKKKRVLTAYRGASEENRIAIPLPKDPIAVGKNWLMDTPIDIQLPDQTVKKITADQQFTLDGVKNDIAAIRFKTRIKTPIDDPKLLSQIIDKHASGSVKLDLDAGHLISQETTINERVIGFEGTGSWIHHQLHFKECCCGLKSCELCGKEKIEVRR